ncbi:MAG: hypothetical protein RR087_11195, partial [Oscillospiraceae bacterium]
MQLNGNSLTGAAEPRPYRVGGVQLNGINLTGAAEPCPYRGYFLQCVTHMKNLYINTKTGCKIAACFLHEINIIVPLPQALWCRVQSSILR